MVKTEETKYSYYENCLELKEKGIHRDVVRFAQIDSFHVFLEMLLTVYIIEMVVLLTNICSRDPSTPIKISPFVVFLPFIIAMFVAIGCVIWALWYFRKKAHEYLNKYFTVSEGETDETEYSKQYEEFIEKYHRDTFRAHSFCTLIYFFISLVIAALLMLLTDLFNPFFIVCVVIIGLSSGILWNWTGYCRHQRILWCRFFPAMRDRNNKTYDEIREKDVEESCKYHRKSIKSIIFSMAYLLALFTFVIIRFHPENGLISIVGLLDKGYGTLFIPFFTLAIAYVKLCYSISFDHNHNAIICHSLEGALSEHPKVIAKGEASDFFEQENEQKINLIFQKLETIEKHVGSIERVVKSKENEATNI